VLTSIVIGLAVTRRAVAIRRCSRSRASSAGGTSSRPPVRLRRTVLPGEAEVETEEHDIDDMRDAIAEHRRRAGRRDIGEELADELLRSTWCDAD
jgi:hypothetical protein